MTQLQRKDNSPIMQRGPPMRLFLLKQLKYWRIKGEKRLNRQWSYHVPLQPPPPVHFLWRRAGDDRPCCGQGTRSFRWSCRHAVHPNFLVRYISAAIYIVSRAKIYVMKKKHVYTCSAELQKSFISTRYLECYPLKLYSFISWFTNTKTMFIRTFSINEKCHNRGWFS